MSETVVYMYCPACLTVGYFRYDKLEDDPNGYEITALVQCPKCGHEERWTIEEGFSTHSED
jgi:RNase P subunit RPR2